MNDANEMDDGHAGDLLSALLDGELDAATESRVRAHVEGCATCAAELHTVTAARIWVRDLPPVDPPFGFYERMFRRARRWGRGAVAGIAAGAAAAVAVVTLAVPAPERPVTPSVGRMVDAHTASASVAGDPLSELTPAATPVSFGR
jgi:anti-sigma factor RsiW